MAVAKSGTIAFLGMNSKRVYNVAFYTADTAGYTCRFNRQGAAGATSSETLRFNENVIMTDFSIPTGTTQVSGYMTEDGGIKDGSALDYVTSVSTNANRPKLVIPFKAGAIIGMVTI